MNKDQELFNLISALPNLHGRDWDDAFHKINNLIRSSEDSTQSLEGKTNDDRSRSKQS